MILSILIASVAIALVLLWHRFGGCKWGLHQWGSVVNVKVRHHGNSENPFDHVCTAERKYCGRCGKNGNLKHVCKHGSISPTEYAAR